MGSSLSPKAGGEGHRRPRSDGGGEGQLGAPADARDHRGHCRDLMPEFGYEPRLSRRSLRHFARPIRGERPREFLKSRAYSVRDEWLKR